MNSTAQLPRLLRKNEAAEALGVSLRTVDTLLARGDLIAVRIGKAVRVDARDLDRFITSRRASNA